MPPDRRPQKKFLPPDTASKEMFDGARIGDETPPVAAVHWTLCWNFPATMPHTVPVVLEMMAKVEAEPNASTGGGEKMKMKMARNDQMPGDVISLQQPQQQKKKKKKRWSVEFRGRRNLKQPS